MPLAPKTKAKPRRPTHHKKRTADHHKKTKHYVKAYWPYLPMLFVAALGIVANAVWGQQLNVLGSQNNLTSQALLEQTNLERSGKGEPTLTIDTRLSEAAQAKAADMVERNYWSHNSPDGIAPWNFIEKTGYSYSKAGENLAYGFANAEDTITAWMNSPEHRANLLGRDYRNVGFGIVNAPSYQGKTATTVIVALYGSPGTGTPEIRFTVPETSANVLGAEREAASRPVSRLAVMSGAQAGWTTFVIVALTSVALLIFVMRHAFRMQRLVNRGEHWVAKHPYLDILIVVIITAGVVLTRSDALIK